MPQPILTVNQRIKLKKREEEKTLLDKQFPRKENEGKREKKFKKHLLFAISVHVIGSKVVTKFSMIFHYFFPLFFFRLGHKQKMVVHEHVSYECIYSLHKSKANRMGTQHRFFWTNTS